MNTPKHVKTGERYAGNQYARITKGSKIDRCYGIDIGSNTIICSGWFLTLSGAKLATELVKLGLTEDKLNFIDCDSYVVRASAVARSKGLSTQEYLESLAQEIVRTK